MLGLNPIDAKRSRSASLRARRGPYGSSAAIPAHLPPQDDKEAGPQAELPGENSATNSSGQEGNEEMQLEVMSPSNNVLALSSASANDVQVTQDEDDGNERFKRLVITHGPGLSCDRGLI